MYNAEQKLRYINKKESEVTLASNFLQNLFNKSEPFEQRLDKDLCEWTTTEIIDYYKYLDVYSFESLSLMHSNYTMYTNWALTETLVLDEQNHFLELDPDALMSCVNTYALSQTILDREMLIKFVDQIPNCTDRFIYYALFEGIAGELFCDITQAHFSDIDVETKTMKLFSGRTVDVSLKLIDVAELAANEEIYHTYGKQPKDLPYREVGTDLIFKTLGGMNLMNENNSLINQAQSLSRRFIRGLDFVGLPRQLTAKRLMVSGKLDYMKGIYNKEEMPLEQFLKERGEEIDKRYPVEKIRSIPMFVRKYGEYFK